LLEINREAEEHASPPKLSLRKRVSMVVVDHWSNSVDV
jgi:hypothetical protein